MLMEPSPGQQERADAVEAPAGPKQGVSLGTFLAGEGSTSSLAQPTRTPPAIISWTPLTVCITAAAHSHT